MSLAALRGGGGVQRHLPPRPTAVVFPATITITKTAIPTATTTFPFTIMPALAVGSTSVSSFSLVNNGTTSNSVAYTLNTSSAFNVVYAFAESAVTGWSLTGLNCTVDSVSGSTASTNGATATITPKQAGIIAGTYTNSEPTGATT